MPPDHEEMHKMRIFPALLVLPLIEIALFVVIGGAIGVWATLGLVVLSALLGLAVVRLHGFQTLTRARRSLEAGADPVGPIAHGALGVLAGLPLIVPGFFTTTAGLLLLLRPVRTALIGWVGARVSLRMSEGAARREPPQPGAAETIEADYEVLDEAPPARRGQSGWTQPH